MTTNPDQELCVLDSNTTSIILKLLLEYGKPDYATQCTIFHASNWCRKFITQSGGLEHCWGMVCPLCKTSWKHKTPTIFGGKERTTFTPDLFTFLAREDSMGKLADVARFSVTYQIFEFLVWLAKIGPDSLTLATFTCVYRQVWLRLQRNPTSASKCRDWEWTHDYPEFRKKMRTKVHWKWTELFSNRSMDDILPLLEAGVWAARERKRRCAPETSSDSIAKRVKGTYLRRQSRIKKALK